MHHDPIHFEPSDAERRGIAASFGVDIAQVPWRLTGGKLHETREGVVFNEMIAGHRIGLWFAGRPRLEMAAATALTHANAHPHRNAERNAQPARRAA